MDPLISPMVQLIGAAVVGLVMATFTLTVTVILIRTLGWWSTDLSSGIRGED